MSGYAFDSNIIIDALAGHARAQAEFDSLAGTGLNIWISRMVWVEVLSKGSDDQLRKAEAFLSAFGMDEIDATVAARAAALRRDRSRLRSPDAIILASAQVHDRLLVTRNIKDFPVDTPGIRVPYLY